MALFAYQYYAFGSDGSLNFDTQIDTSGINKGTKQAANAFSSGMAGAAKAAASDIGQIFANATSVFIGNAMTALSGKVTELGKNAVEAGESFESQMAKVSAISGATGSELDALKAKAKEMGANTVFSASEAGQAFEYMAMAGWKTDDMLTSISGIMNLAAASGEDLGTVSDILTDAMTAFGLAADGVTNGVSNAAHFADILAAASSNSNTNVSMMGETFKYVAPVAGALGFSVEDTAQAIGLMANAGIKGSQAGTALRGMFSRLAKPTKEVQGAMDSLGLSITNSDGTMKSLDSIIGDLRGAFAGLSEAEKAQAAASIAGQEGMSGLLAIVNASQGDFDKLKGAITGAGGAAESMADTMLDTLSGKKKLFESAAEGLSLAIYEHLQEPLKGLFGWGADAVSRLTEGLQSGGVSGLLKAAAGIANEVVKKITSKGPALLNAGKLIITSVIDGVQAAIPKIFEIAGKIIPRIIGAIQAAIPKLFKIAADIIPRIISRIRDAIPGMIQAVQDVIPGVIAAVQTALPKIVQAAGSIFKGITGTVRDLTPRILAAGQKVLTAITGFIKTKGPALIKAAMDALIGKIGFMAGIVKMIADAAPDMLAAAGKLFKSLVTYIGEHQGEIIGAIQGLFSGAADLGSSLYTGFAAALGFVFESITAFLQEHGGEIITGVINILTWAANTITENAPLFLGPLEEAFWGIVAFIAEHAPGIITAVGAAISQLVEALPGLMDEAVQLFGSLITKAAEAMDGHGQDIIDATLRAIASIIESITGSLPDILEKGGEIVANIVTGILNALPDIADAIGKLALEALKSLATHLPDILQAGVRLVGQIAAGIIRGIPSVLQAIVNLLEYAFRTLNEVNWLEVGYQCMLSILKGIFQGLDLIIDAIDDIIGIGIKSLLGAFGVDLDLPKKQKEKHTYDTYKNADEWVTRNEKDLRAGYQTVGAIDTTDERHGGGVGQQFEIDYERMGSEMSKAMSGTKVEIDGRAAGQVMTPYVNSNLSKQAATERRGAR